MGRQAGKYSAVSKPRRKNSGRRMVLLILIFLLIAAIPTALLALSSLPDRPAPEAGLQYPSEPTGQLPTEPVTVPTSPPVVSPTGDKTQVSCKASYTVSSGTPGTVVATAGDKKLTAGMLQVLYLSQVNAWRTSGVEIMPDFSQPLDGQLCPLEDGLSWQHHFLKSAILGWQAQQAALTAAEQPRIITEEYFHPNQTSDLHGEYIAPDLPVNDFLYQDEPCYRPNRLHQAYLDSLEDTLDSLAAQAGFSGLAQMARAAGADAQDFLQAARDYNLAYMFFTEESYDVAPSDAEVSAYQRKNAAALAELGGGSETVDIRQILLVPQGSKGPDGTVTATAQQWAQVQAKADEIMAKWKAATPAEGSENAFAQLASKYSADTGAPSGGGLYASLSPGQLIEPLREWCFANGRQQGDLAVLRSDYGLHIVYLSAIREDTLSVARQALVRELEGKNWAQWLKAVPLSVDYTAAALWADTTVPIPSLEDALYPDIAHQRFPEVMVYLQQDFFFAPFGSRMIGQNGCGITTFAMLATYMTDSYQTPPVMAVQYGEYYDEETHGTNGDLFLHAPCQMGFYLDKVSFDLEEVIQALKDGKIVISRQEKGDFTSSGHYILIQHYNEEDGTFQVRDSNVYNYGSKRGHRTDGFTRQNILSGGAHFYIIQPKAVSTPACLRCGDPENCVSPLAGQDYLCPRCVSALDRRNAFLSLMDEFSYLNEVI